MENDDAPPMLVGVDEAGQNLVDVESELANRVKVPITIVTGGSLTIASHLYLVPDAGDQSSLIHALLTMSA